MAYKTLRRTLTIGRTILKRKWTHVYWMS